MRKSSVIVFIVLLTIFSGCTRLPRTGVTPLQPASLSELRGYLLNRKADLELFRLRGPFAVDTRKDFFVHLSAAERIEADLYLSAPSEKTALVVFLHGLGNSKEDHAYQAMHVASWGMHSLVLQLPNQGPWTVNGRILGRITELIQRQPDLIDRRIDVSRIIFVGYSYGASAVAVAMAEGAPTAGRIMLDPAGIGKNLPNFLAKIEKPVMLLGADEQLAQTRDRDYFYTFVRSGIAEVSIKGASHEDAQYPAEFPVQLFASESSDTEEFKITFVSALTSAALSLSFTGNFDYAWASFGDAIKNGKLFNPKRK